MLVDGPGDGRAYVKFDLEISTEVENRKGLVEFLVIQTSDLESSLGVMANDSKQICCSNSLNEQVWGVVSCCCCCCCCGLTWRVVCQQKLCQGAEVAELIVTKPSVRFSHEIEEDSSSVQGVGARFHFGHSSALLPHHKHGLQ